MKKQEVRTLFLILLTAMCALMLLLATMFAWQNPAGAKAETTPTAEVTGVQVRSGGGAYNFIVLQNEAYSSVNADTTVSNTGNYNTKEKVKIYTSADQTEGVYLTSVCGGWWTQNLWGSGGLMLAVDDYNTYNGATIYKITIEAGCELPCGDTVYVTAEEASYINQEYGQESVKNSAFNWIKYVKPTATAEVTGIQMRAMTGTNDWYAYLVIQSEAYSGLADKGDSYESKEWETRLTAEKIRLYTSEEDTTGKTLSELGVINATQNRWGVSGVFLCFNGYYSGGYGGSEVYKVVIEEGCELPIFGETMTSVSVNKKYTYTNGDYGNADKKFSATDNWTKSPEITKEEISLDGVQMRGLTDGWYYYLVLQSSAYNGMSATDGNFAKTYTTFDKIRLYTSEKDTTGTSLSALTVQHVERNYGNWTDGLFINFAEYDSTYGGHQVYKIVIEQGCELLADLGDGEAKVFVVNKEYSYYNGDYNDETVKIGAMRWGSFDDVYKGVAYGKSISLEGEISVNFYIRLLDKNARAEFTENGITTELSYADSTPVYFNGSDKEYRLFSYRVAAKNYGNDVKLTIIPAKDGVNAWSVTASVRAYAEETIADGAVEQKLKDLSQSLLNYCAAANAYFNNDTVAAYSGDVDLSAYQPTGSGSQEGVTLLGATLVLESKTEIKVYFSGENAGAVACYVNGNAVDKQQDGDRYVVTVEYIAAQNLGDVQEIKIGGYTINYSALSYAYAVTGNTSETDTNLINLVKYLYDYNVKAKLFF